MPSHVLALDTGSPIPSVALCAPSAPPASRVLEPRACSERLLGCVDDLLAESGTAIDDLAGVVALRGPGSFTGLRVGLATALGLHQALGLPATALPTLEVIAAWAMDRLLSEGDPFASAPGLVVVDALRGRWFVATAQSGRSLGEARHLDDAGLAVDPAARRSAWIAGFGARRLSASTGLAVRSLEPEALAPTAAGLLLERARGGDPSVWDPATLIAPLYLRPPAVTPPAALRPTT